MVMPLKFYKKPKYFASERSMFDLALIRMKDLVYLINIVSGPKLNEFLKLDVSEEILKVIHSPTYND